MTDKTNRIVKYTLNALFVLFIIIILIFSIYGFSSKKNNGVPKFFGKSSVAVLSDSMKGKEGFKKGDLIFIEHFDLETINDKVFEVGDVITFRVTEGNQQHLLTHRIREVRENEYIYITQGDVEYNSDKKMHEDHVEYVDFNDVVGVYTGKKIAGLGGFFTFLQSPAGFFIFIVIPLLLFLAFQVYDFYIAFKAFKKEKEQLATKTNTDDSIE